jgi:hypothetical protein
VIIPHIREQGATPSLAKFSSCPPKLSRRIKNSRALTERELRSANDVGNNGDAIAVFP